jgi:hypothetical protein
MRLTVTDSPAVRRLVEHARLWRAIAHSGSTAPRTAESSLGLTYQPGDRVFDLITGEVVTVHAGHQIADLVSAPRPQLD